MQLLTDTKVRQAKAQDKPYRLLDGDGLHLEVRPSGAKVWLYRYWITSKKGGIYTIGAYDDVSLAEARRLRDEACVLVRKGLNPTKERKLAALVETEERDLTLAVVAAKWQAENAASWSPSYKRQVERFLRQDLLDTYGELPIKLVTSRHILQAIKKVEGRGAKSIAKLIRQWAGGIMRYAIANLMRDDDPTYALRGAIKMPATKHHAHLVENELPEFLRALKAYKGFGLVPLAVELLLLTFVRTGELRRAEWSEFDLREKVWRIPGGKMKARRQHIVPLSSQAVEILKQLQKMNWRNSAYLFPNVRRPSDCITSTTVLRAIELMGFKGRVTGHGFRGSASTILHEKGWPTDVIERQLAHTEKNKSKASYDHAEYLPKRREMMQWWADFLDEKAKESPCSAGADLSDLASKTE